MNKKFYGTLLLGTLLLGSTIVSCKDYDDDIDNLQNQITQLATKADMQSEVSKLQSAVATAQAAAENKAAAAEQAAKDAAAKAQAAADAAAKAQGTADAAATVEALEKVAADAAAAAKAAEEAKVAAETKAAELASQLAELQALAATLVSTEDFEAAKKELNDKYAELAAKIGETTGTTGMTGLQVLSGPINVGYGVWAGVHKGAQAAEWDGPKKEEVAKLAEGDYVSAFGANEIQIAVNPTDVDVTNTEFAVVNQYGEIAPVAFGTPEVLTRANAAGTYKVKIASAALTSDVVKEFGKNFEKDSDGANATLVAGKIASTLTKNFVAVSKTLNSSVGEFGAEVKYDEISGSVEVVANNPENVYDSYITGLNGVSAHDSLVWNLKYDGMTLTYNAEAAKKFANDTEFKVKVKEINLNGYIHEKDATIKFLKKETVVEEVELEGNVAARTHAVQLNATHPTTGANMQVESITKAQILEALKIKAGSEAAIHFDHIKANWTATAGTPFYYTADNDVVKLAAAVGSADVTKDANNNFTGVVYTFATNYDKAKFAADATAGDFLTNGMTLYIPVVLTGKDEADLGDPTEYTYTVNVPVKFEMPNANDLFSWKDNLFTDNTTYSIAYLTTTPRNFKAAKGVEYAAVAPTYDKNTNNINVKAIKPSVTVELDYQNMQSYKKIKAVLDELEISKTVPTTTIPVSGTTIRAELFSGKTTVVNADSLSNAYKKLEDLYKKSVVVPLYRKYTTPGSTSSYSDATFAWNAKDRCWKTANTDSIVTIERDYLSDGYYVYPLAVDENYSFKVKGMHVSILGRTVGINDVTVNHVATGLAPADYTATLSYNKYINETNAPILKFYNANVPVVDASQFVGSFSITDKYDLPYIFDDSYITGYAEGAPYNETCVVTRIDANGIEYELAKTTAPNANTYAKIFVYASEKNADGDVTAKHWGVQITPQVIADANAGDKIVVKFTTNLKRKDGTVFTGKTLSFELVVAE